MRRDDRSGRHRVRRYVDVILEMAERQDTWETWDRDLAILRNFASGRARLLGLRPGATADQRVEALQKLAGDLLSATGSGFARVLIEDDSLELATALWAQFYRRSESEGPVSRVTVTSAEPLERAELDELKRRVSRAGRKLLFQFNLDSEVMGGIVVRQGDWRKDLTVRARLGAVAAALR